MQIYGVEAIIRVISHFVFINLTFWSIQSLNYEKWFKKAPIGQIRAFLLILSIVLGYTVSYAMWDIFSLFSNFVFSMKNG
ncbi:DUF1146 family protein [Vagococcus xieshaowenii]|uniref:DUF1146 domain-containing protein n=1 Tax=Vagococcus xieshaowenii TaxID=2562451 RepID=A0A4Z0DCR8_9ENTE|nr:DUF1146 family protein [Vagococcus xieshaowenii]QCA28513.1 DUF1146 domain-containing protein [Vagococcus xieshaowenii]TFZ42733.1 DUF1146 domain-containing protein [Vagococcus xieshaowenii]